MGRTKIAIFRLQYLHISYKTDGCEREITFRITIYWLDNRPENIEEILIVYDREAFLIFWQKPKEISRSSYNTSYYTYIS